MRPRLVGSALIAALAVMQALWIVSVPPYRGLDEVDHARRAASVAGGEWGPSTVRPPEGLPGMLVRVPADIAAASEPQCAALTYRDVEHCAPVREYTDGTVTVATSAYAQSPVFYGVVGTLARSGTGAGADLVMRVASAVLVLLMFSAAVFLALRRSRTLWPAASLCALLSPIYVYSSIIPAGNGLEIAAGMTLWSVLLYGSRDGFDRRALWIGFAACLCLVSLRQLGPVLLVLIVLHAVAMTGFGRLRESVRDHKGLTSFMALSVVAAGLVHLSWIRGVGYPGYEQSFGSYPWPRPVTDVLQWTFQAFATGQSRVTPAPLGAYALAMPPTAVLLALAFIMARRARMRAGLAAILVTSIALPVAFSYVTFPAHGAFWQGRYGLGFLAGGVLAAGLVLEERGRIYESRVIGIATAVAMVGSNAVTLTWFVRTELSRAVSVNDPVWLTPGAVSIFTGIAVTLGILAVAFVPAYRRRDAVVARAS